MLLNLGRFENKSFDNSLIINIRGSLQADVIVELGLLIIIHYHSGPFNLKRNASDLSVK